MIRRLLERLTYWTERRFLRGASYRLAFIAMAIGAISIAGGIVVIIAGTGFSGMGDATWWAFLRLTDPGYLGDDVGTVNRVVSTVLTILGYVVFLGALVAVMTQWLQSRMSLLERGLTPVARDGHVLILGWTNRTPAIVRELLLSEGRVRRFLKLRGAKDLHVVVLAEEVDSELARDLKDAVGDVWDDEKVTLRTGTPLRSEHLSRVDAWNAAVVLVPASEFEGSGVSRADAFTLKTLLSLEAGEHDGAGQAHTDRGTKGRSGRRPPVVAEIFDARKIGVAQRAYRGPLQLVGSDAVVSRLLSQNVRHPGLSRVYNELLTHDGGCEIYVRDGSALAGVTFERLGGAFTRSILLGVVREEGGVFTPYLNPSGDFEVRANDRLVHLAASYEDIELEPELPADPWRRGRPGAPDEEGVERRVLILGWNHKVPALIKEFGTHERGRFDVTLFSTVSKSRRVKALERYGAMSERVSVEQIEGDLAELADLAALEPHGFDKVILVGSDWIQDEDESDARTIVGALLLGHLGLPSERTQTIVELLDPENVRLMDTSQGEVIISPLILSHMLAQVALRPELGAVFSRLFAAGDAEIAFTDLAVYAGGSDTVSFGDVQRRAWERGEVALGIRRGTRPGELDLNPGPERTYRVDASSKVVTIVTYV